MIPQYVWRNDSNLGVKNAVDRVTISSVCTAIRPAIAGVKLDCQPCSS